MIFKYPAIALLLIALTGCATAPQPIPPQVAYVPVVKEAPEPPKVTKPDLPIDHLSKNATPAEIAKAYVLSIEIEDKFIAQLMNYLDAYRHKDKTKK